MNYESNELNLEMLESRLEMEALALLAAAQSAPFECWCDGKSAQ